MKPIGNGTLFISDAVKRFNAVTKDRYRLICARMAKKGYTSMPFTLDQYQAHFLKSLQGVYDGAITCRYCRRILDFADAVGDHAVPLSRGGSADLNNIEFICAPCNDQKGSCLPSEWELCLEFFETHVPFARTDLLGRLQKATKLAASMRFNMARITELKNQGAWQKAGKRTRKRKPAIEEPF